MVTTASTKVRDAAQFVLEKKTENPKASLTALIDEAGMRYNLTPLDTQALTRILSDDKK
ncbi:MAG: hypothetical protein Q4F72_10520 [Desulfovibrionaceae bacterium]|nr:hypothetical protein [Desulfovibrionaceae bacterium]